MMLYERLKAYGDSEIYPFHMPGHKRRSGHETAGEQSEFIRQLYAMDITEIDGFDDLHHAEGILKEAQDLAARLYGSEETHFLVGGSTAGMMSAIAATVRPGGEIMVARNCHKSVYHAMEIHQLRPHYIYPKVNTKYGIFEGICPQDVEEMWISHPNISAIVVTSPTYEGVVSDIRRLAEIAHSHGIPLIVDEAHGAHFRFSEYFPVSAVDLGADLVIQSTHKTLSAMTSTALIHCNGPLVDRQRLRRMLGIYQTSSPSYILMGSIDACMHQLRDHGEAIFKAYTNRLQKIRSQLHENEKIHLPELADFDRNCTFDYDRSKLFLSVKGTDIDGRTFHDLLLQKYGLQMEMKTTDSVLAMTGPGDDDEGYERLVRALNEIDRCLDNEKDGIDLDSESEKEGFHRIADSWPKGKTVMLSGQAVWEEKEEIPYTQAENRICADYIYLYPPGIPLVVPGELMTAEIIAKISYWIEKHMEVTGLIKRGGTYGLFVLMADK